MAFATVAIAVGVKHDVIAGTIGIFASGSDAEL
jgi:hypothetical protein